MKLNDLISKIGNNRYLKITWLSELSSSMTEEAKRRGFIVTKQVTSIVELNRGGNSLPWGNYYRTNYLIRYHGNLYLRIRAVKEPEIQYYVNGTAMDRSDIEQFPVMKPSYWLNKDTKGVNEMVLKLTNIKKLEVLE